MTGLRQACDEHVAAEILRLKQSAMSQGAGLDLVGALRDARLCPMVGYLAAVLTEDAEEVSHLVDELVDDAVDYLQQGVDSGMIKPTPDPRGRAVVLMMWSLGTLVMRRHLHRLLGVDLSSDEPVTLGAYIGPIYEIYGAGLFTEAFTNETAQTVTRLSHESERG